MARTCASYPAAALNKARLPILVAAVRMLPEAAIILDAELTAAEGFYALQS